MFFLLPSGVIKRGWEIPCYLNEHWHGRSIDVNGGFSSGCMIGCMIATREWTYSHGRYHVFGWWMDPWFCKCDQESRVVLLLVHPLLPPLRGLLVWPQTDVWPCLLMYFGSPPGYRLHFIALVLAVLKKDVGLSENRVYSQWNSHLIGIMISKTIGYNGVHYFQTHPCVSFSHHSVLGATECGISRLMMVYEFSLTKKWNMCEY